MLEVTIELKACVFAVNLGIRTPKLRLTSQASWPDRTFLYGGHVMFIEFKQPGEKPTPLQQFTIDSLRKDGFIVHVCSDIDDATTKILEWRNDVDRQLARLRAGHR